MAEGQPGRVGAHHVDLAVNLSLRHRQTFVIVVALLSGRDTEPTRQTQTESRSEKIHNIETLN